MIYIISVCACVFSFSLIVKCIWVYLHVCVCVWGGPTQSVMCVSVEHKAVCSRPIGPERVNTLPSAPHTHDPAGLSAPLNMTIHPLHGTCVCLRVVFSLFLDALMCACTVVCLRTAVRVCASITHVHHIALWARVHMRTGPCAGVCTLVWLTDWSVHSAGARLCAPRPHLHGHVWESKQRSILCTLALCQTDREMVEAQEGSGY